MNPTHLKKIVLLILSTMIISCSADDENIDINLNLLYGQWFKVDMCPEQNNLTFNSDKSYIWRTSGNTDCSINDTSTFQAMGTFSISGKNLNFNEESYEEIIEGENGWVSEIVTIVYTHVVQLTETELHLERKILRGPGDNPEEVIFNLNFTK